MAAMTVTRTEGLIVAGAMMAAGATFGRVFTDDPAVVAEFGDATETQRLAARTAKGAGCSYAIRIGRPNPSAGYVGLPGGGPILTWRAINDDGVPPLSNWALGLGDIELF